MKRSFRVGVAFTGAAAATAGLAGVAQAAPAIVKPASIHAGNCGTGASTTQLHLWYRSGHPTPACVSGNTVYPHSYIVFPAKNWKSYCGGIYSGKFKFSNSTSGHFTHGATLHKLYHDITSIIISRVNVISGNWCAD